MLPTPPPAGAGAPPGASGRAAPPQPPTGRPPLDPAVARTRLVVREALAAVPAPGTVIVAVSGGADSLALATAVGFEAPKLGLRAASVTVDHGLQAGSDAVAADAARIAARLGLDARVVAVQVSADGAGIEAAARDARYSALFGAARDAGAAAVLTAHTLDDQAETVLLGLARGAGATSLSGMPPVSERDGILLLRPFLSVRRAETEAVCAAQGLEPWRDPHNDDPRFARVRVRRTVLPVLEAELGPGVAEALARTAQQSQEDAAAFAEMIDETIEDIVEHAEAGIAVSASALAANPAALRHRIIRHVVAAEFHTSLTRSQTLEVARLVNDWTGQGPIDLPGCRARRAGALIVFEASGTP